MTSSLALFFLQAGADAGFFNLIVNYFNQGGPWMWPVLVTFILGLAIFSGKDYYTEPGRHQYKKVCCQRTERSAGRGDSRCSGVVYKNQGTGRICISGRSYTG